MKTPLNAGFGRTDITPDLGSLLMGYPRPDRAATGVRDGLAANALALSQGNATAVVVSLTVCIVDDVESEAIRRAVAPEDTRPANYASKIAEPPGCRNVAN